MSARTKRQMPRAEPKRFLPARRPYMGKRPEATRPPNRDSNTPPDDPRRQLFDDVDYDVHLGRFV